MSDDLHPIELVAHSVLNNSLENLNDNFGLLYKSQTALLTRLKIIETRLREIDTPPQRDKVVGKLINDCSNVQERLNTLTSLAKKIEKRLDSMEREMGED